MSKKAFDPNDPRLTAYVLGELNDAERLEIEQQIEQCSATRAAVEEIRKTVGQLTYALAQETIPTLSDAQRTAITTATPLAAKWPTEHSTTTKQRRRDSITALVAGLTVVVAAVFLLILPPFHRDPANDVSSSLVRADLSDRSFHVASDFFEKTHVDYDFNVQDDLAGPMDAGGETTM